MITIRKSEARGHANHGWLDSHHSFSFADYHDPAHMGYANLRVINEDRIAPGTGFGTHGHRDMEIVSYVLAGALAHRDSMGDGGEAGVLRPGDVQRMTAGTGVRHSEFNHSPTAVTHFLQIWLLPREAGLPPSYEQTHVDRAGLRGRLRLIGAPGGSEGGDGGVLALNARARLHAGLFDGGEHAEMAVDPTQPAYVHVLRGTLALNGIALKAGDGAQVTDEPRLVFTQGCDAEVLVFELSHG